MGRRFGLWICIRITHCSLLLPKFLNHTHSCREKVCSFTAWLAGRCGKFCLGDKMLGELGRCCLKSLVMTNFRVNESFLILLHFFFFTRFRILGFYRAPPVVGRKINLEEEVEPIGEKRLMDTFFKEGRKGLRLNEHINETFSPYFCDLVWRLLLAARCFKLPRR